MATRTITITGTGFSGRCQVFYNSKAYYSATTFTAEDGDELNFYTQLGSMPGTCGITLDGVSAGSGQANSNWEYVHTVASDLNVVLNYANSGKTSTIAIETINPDPMAPYDGHNTNIGQVARQIEAGNVLFGGVSREIENGLTLVGGVSREIPFDDGVVTIEITGQGNSSRCYVSIDGTKYTTKATLEIPNGTIITCGVAYYYTKGAVYLNGELVHQSNTTSWATTYEYTAERDATINLNRGSTTAGPVITITEE